ncbi:hypothetical protein PENDEC_c037G04473 [Penicillium decumbens]|uniref:Ig-like domain-containing protein n=1 Tax=Penicillium decumbens TaxID=69771 RepID=A0A1V6NS10_PENDC|nr:hypothetical protein PENDEC_c037G04473 [Penicillium decumbens]
MHFSTVLTLSTSLLAAQVSAQIEESQNNPINPMAIHNPNLYSRPTANANPSIPAYMAPLVSSMASAMAATMAPMTASTPSSTGMHHAPMAWADPMAPHSNLPTYSDVPMYSQGSMYSHLAMSSSAPYHSTPYSHGSMLTKASSTPLSSRPTPAPTHAFNQPQHPPFHPALAHAQPGEGGIAPIQPMAPGTNVAPVQLNQQHGADEGNAFCIGLCYPSEEAAQYFACLSTGSRVLDLLLYRW